MKTGIRETSETSGLKHKPLYVYGTRVWLARLKIVIIYSVAALLVIAGYMSWQEYVNDNDLDTMNIVFRSSLLFGLWLIAVVTSWRQGMVRASRVVYVPEHDLLEVRTLNFLSRKVPLSKIRRIEYPHIIYQGMLMNHAHATISVRDGLPIELDTSCVLFERSIFDQLFQHYNEPATTVARIDGMIP